MKSKDICLPNYKDGSIVNLMSSIARASGGRTPYSVLRDLSPRELKKYKNIVLVVIDGLGYNYLLKNGKGSVFNENLKGSMTSVFLPTTACAVTSFLTGVAPQQHAFTGWFVNLKEIGVVTKVLPFVPRVGGDILSKQGVEIKEILGEEAFTSKIKRRSFVINPSEVFNSDFTKYTSKKAKRLSHRNLDGFFGHLKRVVRGKGKKYVYAYWQEFDKNAHETGVGSKKTLNHFKKLDRGFKKFVKNLDKDTILIVTSDHGFIDSSLNKEIHLDDHPKLKECLSLPLCGEGRVAYCYVKLSKVKDFERYVHTRLRKYCWMYKSEELIKKNVFGLGKPNPKLFDRVGDYILVMKDNYIIRDKVLGQGKKFHIGHHAGVSKDEMLVPLVVVKKDD